MFERSPRRFSLQSCKQIEPKSELPHTDIPQTLYFSSKGLNNPSLQEMRDALRRQQFDHSRYDFTFGSKWFKTQYAVKDVTKIDVGTVDDTKERSTNVIKEIIPVHENALAAKAKERQRIRDRKQSITNGTLNAEEQQERARLMMVKKVDPERIQKVREEIHKDDILNCTFVPKAT